ITDNDGDVAVQTENIGTTFYFRDDGPSIALSAEDTPALIVDDSNLNVPVFDDFSILFTPDFGNDSFKNSNNDDNEDLDAVRYALGISAPEVLSGLIDTLSNEPVELVMDGLDVVGRTQTGHVEVFRV